MTQWRQDTYVGFFRDKAIRSVRAARQSRLNGDTDGWLTWMIEAQTWRERLIAECRKPCNPEILRIRAETDIYRRRIGPPWG